MHRDVCLRNDCITFKDAPSAPAANFHDNAFGDSGRAGCGQRCGLFANVEVKPLVAGLSVPIFEPTISTHDSHVSHVFSRTSAATWSHLSC